MVGPQEGEAAPCPGQGTACCVMSTSGEREGDPGVYTGREWWGALEPVKVCTYPGVPLYLWE